MQRIVFAVGLTGGHIYPAKALAEDLGKDRCEFLFIARASSPLAQKILKDEGFPVLPVKTRGLPRNFKDLLIYGPLFFWQQLCGILLLLKAFRDWRPDLVIGFGGYVSFPAVLAAWILRIPRIIFEPNAKLGLANKILTRFSHRTVCTFDLGIKKSVKVTPPLRSGLLEAKNLGQDSCRDFFGLEKALPCVLVFGGSHGAHVINEAFKKAVSRLRQEDSSFSFIHIAGNIEHESLKNFYEEQGFPGSQGVCLNYLEDMATAYRAASLIVCRSGAMTCLELMHFRTPAILIPLSHAAESHQLKNAQALENLGLAQIIPEDDRLREALYEALRKMLKDRSREPAILKTVSLNFFKDVVLEMLSKKQ